MKKLLLSFLCMLTLFAASATETSTTIGNSNFSKSGSTISGSKDGVTIAITALDGGSLTTTNFNSYVQLLQSNAVTVTTPTGTNVTGLEITCTTSNYTNGSTFSVSSGGGSVSTSGSKITWTNSSSTSNTVTLNKGNGSQSRVTSFKVTYETTSTGGDPDPEPSTGDTYTLITSDSQLFDGAEVILAVQDGTSWIGVSSSGTAVSDITSSGNTITYTSGLGKFIVKSTDNSEYPWALKKDGTSNYIGNAASGANFNTNNTLGAVGFCLKYIANPSSGLGCVQCNNTNSQKHLLKNGNNIKFYANNSSYGVVKVFLKDSATPPTPEKTPVTLAFSESSVTCEQGLTPTAPTLTVTPAEAASSVVYESSNTSVATVNPSTGAITLGSATGSTTITASIPDTDANYTCTSPASYTLTVSESTAIGEISASTAAGTYPNGTEVTFTCPNAGAMELVVNYATEDFPIEYEESITYTLNHTNGDYYNIVVRAYDENLEIAKTATYVFQIQAPGTVTVSPAAVNSDITITEGSAITITAGDNIDKISYEIEYYDDIVSVAGEWTVDATHKVFTLTPAGDGEITLTPSLANYPGTTVSYDIVIAEPSPSSDAMFIFNTDAGLTELGITIPSSSSTTGTIINNRTLTKSKAHLAFAQNSGSTACRVWNSSGTLSLKTYTASSGTNHSTITATVDAGYKITKITITGSGKSFTATPGTYTTSTGIWTPAAETDVTSVVLKTSAKTTINTITVTYEPIAAPTQVAQPTVTVASGASNETISGVNYYTNAITLNLACTTEGVTYHYSTDDGATYTEVSGNSFQLNAPVTTLKVKATKDGLDDSPIAEAGPFRFAPAKPVLKAVKDDATNSYNVTITSATEGATIMYSTDGGATWSTYTGEAVNFTDFGETTVTAKAAKEGYTLTESQTDDVHFTIYNPADILRFELVTDPTILKADDKVIIVALNYNKAMAPYESGKNNCASVDITKIDVEEDNYHAIELQPDQQAVEIFTLVSHTDGETNYWRFKPEYTSVKGFLYAPTTSTSNTANNYMKVGEPTASNVGNKCNATLTAAADGAMKIEFSEATRNIIRYNSNSPYIFSCYAEGACDPVALYVLTSSKEQVARPVISRQEGIYDEGDLSEGVTITCATPGAVIRYTTDGQDARLYGDTYEPGTVIPVSDCTIVRAYAFMPDESMFPSPSLIATYHLFSPGKVFSRVTDDDMKYLGVGDEVIIVASPTDDSHSYAIGTTQISHDGDIYRQAIDLGENAVDANGNLILPNKTVQPFVILSGLDRTANYDWRLYASGTLDQGQPGAVFDGYLYSEGENNSLETVRIDDPNSPDMPNADVTFHSQASTGIGNEYGGVTVEFGATSGQENFPNHMGLHKVSDDHFHFNCYTLDEINAGSDIYHVSIFKAYSTTVSGVPAFSHTNVSEPLDKGTQISLTTRDPNAVIYYTTDGSTPTTESAIYTQPIRLNNSCTIKAFAVSEGMEPSPVAEQTYRVRVTRVFELVDVNTKLEEGDEIIFVNAIAYDPADPKGEIKDNPNGRYYALTDTKLDGKDYYQAAELTPEDTPMGKNHRVALTQIDGETLPMDNNQTSHDHVIVAKLELDGSGSAESAIRPWLLNYGGRYFYSTSGHQLSFVDLPENIEDRAGINVGIDIINGEDYYTTGTNKQKIYNKATAVFSGAENTFTSMRFNHPTSASDNSLIRFNAYGFDYDNEADVQHTNTYPVSIYRAIDRIEEPSLTIYPTDVAVTKETGVQTYETEGTAPGRSIFYNPVKIVIKQNLHTSAGATLKYAWSKTVQNAPVASEYTPVAGQQIVIELDGFNARINGGEPGSISTFSNNTDFMQTVIRAMAELGEQNSPSLPREIHFRTVAPGIEPGAVENGRRYLDLVRPETYTVGADIWYTTDGTDPVPNAANAILVDKAPGHVMATINVPVGSTVKVGAFRPGFEPDITTYTENTYYPGVRAMQLVELTPDGKAALNNTTAKYLTYRTPADFNKYVDAHYYTVDPVYDEDATTGIADIVLTQVAAEDAQAVFADPANFRWTADYYVFALNGNKFENAITGLQDGWSVTVQDSEGANITAHKTTLTVDQDGEETEIDYYGAILQRHGQLGQNTVTSHLTYTADGGTFPTSSPASFITPAMPRPYGLTYRYETVRDLPEDYMRYGDFEFVTGSSIPGHENEENYLIFPAEQYTLRHFNCVFEFNRPNVSLDIIENYDIVYDIAVVTYSDIDDLQGYYGDPSRESAEPHTYSFVVNDVHPDAAIYPTMFINNVYYVPNGDNDGYSLLEANYGDTESTLYRQSIEARNTVSASAPGLNFEMGYYTNNNGTIDWAIRSHTEVTNPGSELHGQVLGAPFMYHVEAHYPKAAAGEDDLYYSHSTLVQHDAENCSHASAELDENDPFYLLTIGKNYASATQYPDIYVTPIYFFMRLPEPSIEEESDLEDYTQSFQAPGNAPAVATMPQRVIRRSTGMHDENDPLIIRGSKPGVFSVEEAINNGGNLTGIEEVSAQPESDAIYYDLKGVRVVADRLQNGIYIRIKGNTATKVLVK